MFAAIGALVALALLAGDGRQVRRGAAQSFDVCLEDDGNKGNALRFSSTTGEYMVCAGGNSFSGTGSVSKSGSGITLQHLAADRRLAARVDTSAKKGSASFQSPPGKTLGTIGDGNTSDSGCRCR